MSGRSRVEFAFELVAHRMGVDSLRLHHVAQRQPEIGMALLLQGREREYDVVGRNG